MANYHINNEGNVGACRATKKPCPFGGWDDHYSSKQEAQKGYEEKQEMLMLLANGKTKEHPLTTKALESSMTYTGKIPEWMNKLSKISESRFGTKPEIIDTVELNGKNYAVVWSNNSMRDVDFHVQKERGYNVSGIEYRSMETGDVAGFVAVGYVNEKSLKKSFGDDDFSSYRSYQDRSGTGKILKEKHIKKNGEEYFYAPVPYDENTDPETRIAVKKELWSNVHKALGKVPEDFDRKKLMWGSLVNLAPEHAPDDETKLDEQILAMKTKIEAENKSFENSHKVPIVDYSELNHEFRGQGLGTSMYVYTARKLAEDGLVLSGSGVQSDSAQSLWKRMSADPRLNIKVITKRYEKKGRSENNQKFALDFRKNDEQQQQ